MPNNVIHPIVLFLLSCGVTVAGAAETGLLDPLMRTVDLNIGQTAKVELCDGTTVAVKLVKLLEERDDLRQAVRRARVTVEVNGQKAVLTSANYSNGRVKRFLNGWLESLQGATT